MIFPSQIANRTLPSRIPKVGRAIVSTEGWGSVDRGSRNDPLARCFSFSKNGFPVVDTKCRLF